MENNKFRAKITPLSEKARYYLASGKTHSVINLAEDDGGNDWWSIVITVDVFSDADQLDGYVYLLFDTGPHHILKEKKTFLLNAGKNPVFEVTMC
jgi:hypothetical protein